LYIGPQFKKRKRHYNSLKIGPQYPKKHSWALYIGVAYYSKFEKYFIENVNKSTHPNIMCGGQTHKQTNTHNIYSIFRDKLSLLWSLYINEWKDVKILVIDEVSFMSNGILMTLNNRLMDIGNRMTSFGGLSIIFEVTSANLNPSV
jgi:hypothetical protein